jgi:hypothetical protein
MDLENPEIRNANQILYPLKMREKVIFLPWSVWSISFERSFHSSSLDSFFPQKNNPVYACPLSEHFMTIDQNVNTSAIQISIRDNFFDYIAIPELASLPPNLLDRVCPPRQYFAPEVLQTLFKFCVEVFRSSGPSATALFALIDLKRLGPCDANAGHK